MFVFCSLCSGAEYLLQIVHEAVPRAYFELNSCIAAADVAAHILNHLYRKLNEVCLVQGGEVCEAMLVVLRVSIPRVCACIHYVILIQNNTLLRRKPIGCYFTYLLGVYCPMLRVLILGFLKGLSMTLLRR